MLQGFETDGEVVLLSGSILEHAAPACFHACITAADTARGHTQAFIACSPMQPPATTSLTTFEASRWSSFAPKLPASMSRAIWSCAQHTSRTRVSLPCRTRALLFRSLTGWPVSQGHNGIRHTCTARTVTYAETRGLDGWTLDCCRTSGS